MHQSAAWPSKKMQEKWKSAPKTLKTMKKSRVKTRLVDTQFFVFFSVSLQNTWCKKDKQESQVNDICNKYLLEQFQWLARSRAPLFLFFLFFVGSDTLDLNISSECATLPHFHADICVCGRKSEEREWRCRERQKVKKKKWEREWVSWN